jgi:Domain of unknown function (DUF5655)
MKNTNAAAPTVEGFLEGKSAHTLLLFHFFVNAFQHVGPVTLHPTKTMIGISNGQKRIAWITALGKNFVHVVFPFAQPYNDNLCFIKIAQVPGTDQYNHHFRMQATDDVNEEVMQFMKRALEY